MEVDGNGEQRDERPDALARARLRQFSRRIAVLTAIVLALVGLALTARRDVA